MTALAPVRAFSTAAPALSVRVVDEYEEFLAMEPLWNELVERCGAAHPFLEHAWVRTWWDCFGAGSRLHIVVVTEGAEPIAIAPLLLSAVAMFGIPVRRLGFFYNSHVPRAEFIVAERISEVYGLIWNHLRRFTDWDLVQLCQLTGGSETLCRMQRRAERDGLPVGLWKSGSSPRIDLNRSWDDYYQALPTKHRSNLRNRNKRFDQSGQVELDTVTGGTRREGALEEGLVLEAAAWKRANGTAILSDTQITRFYRQFSGLAAERGWLRLNFLRVNGRAVAFDYSLEYAGRIFLLKLGYDPEFSSYSPSNLLLGAVLKQAFAAGLTEYDFLGEEADWKRCWTSDTEANFWLCIFAPSLKGRLLHQLKFKAIPALRRSKTVNRISAVLAGLPAAFRKLNGRTSH